ncbi:nucleotide sugar dehydrogenase [Candidatus Bathyarchaeota archaeon]|nr:nucleotide sugar dehydrogenase [Candidatus Bathyarchaeota archaeon]
MKEVKASIIGSGVVGQATGMGLALNGNEVLFYDIDQKKLRDLEEKGYEITDNLTEAVTESDILFVAVPTPTVDKKIVLDIVQDCTKGIGKVLAETWKYVDVVYRSTIPPGTTRSKLIPGLENNSGLKAGKDFGVCMNPEFLREKTPLEDFLHPSRIVIGEYDERSGNALTGVYSQFRGPIIRTTLDSAEMIKYTSNLFLASKISFFNEIYTVCEKLKIDPNIVGQAVALDPRIGAYGSVGGRPFGGMCLPKDLAAFLEFADSMGLDLKLLKAVGEVNEEMNQLQAEKQILEKKRR